MEFLVVAYTDNVFLRTNVKRSDSFAFEGLKLLLNIRDDAETAAPIESLLVDN